jgi:hypothetical protein
VGAAERNRIVEPPVASVALRWDAMAWVARALRVARALQTPAAAEKKARPVPAERGPLRAQGHAAAWAQLPPLRLHPSDSRSPDRTSVTPGSLCRSGYTSQKIAQSLVPVSITSNWGRSASGALQPNSTTATSERGGRAIRESARSRPCGLAQSPGTGRRDPARCCPSNCASGKPGS